MRRPSTIPLSGVREAALRDVPIVQGALARAGWPMIRRVMATYMAVGPGCLSELKRRIDGELDWADTLIAKGGPLECEGFGRGFITAASMLAPLALPKAMTPYRRVRFVPEAAQIMERWLNPPVPAMGVENI